MGLREIIKSVLPPKSEPLPEATGINEVAYKARFDFNVALRGANTPKHKTYSYSRFEITEGVYESIHYSTKVYLHLRIRYGKDITTSFK